MKTDIQLFAKKDIVKKKSKSLKKAIKKYNELIAEHQEKIKNPSAHTSNWDNKDVREHEGLLRHWNKEIRNFQTSIDDRIKKLKARGDYDE